MRIYLTSSKATLRLSYSGKTTDFIMIITGIIAVLFLLGISFRGDCSVPESTALSESEWHELLKEIERYET